MLLWTGQACLWDRTMQHLDCSLEASECKMSSAVFVNEMNIEHDMYFTSLGCYMLWDCDLLLMWGMGQIVTCVQHWQITERKTRRRNTVLDLWQSHYERKNCTLINLRGETGGAGETKSLIRVTGYDNASDNAARIWLVKQLGNGNQSSEVDRALACANWRTRNGSCMRCGECGNYRPLECGLLFQRNTLPDDRNFRKVKAGRSSKTSLYITHPRRKQFLTATLAAFGGFILA
jgi:hypothetical protein